MGQDLESQRDQELALEEAQPEIKLPPMYRVILLNDDYTPMDFVIEILSIFFGMSHDRATQVMLHVHTRGQGVCGIFTFEIAETKVVQVNEFSNQNDHPLKCTMEKT
ncbi:MAG: ATP-dependent Clp protease adapter ClpS [Xanthomonadales bacterium]